MKWKFASYMTLGCVFAIGAINALRSVAQQPGIQPPGSLPPGSAAPESLPPGSVPHSNPPRVLPPRNVQERGILVPNSPTLPGLNPLGNFLPNGPRMVPFTRTITNPDGTEVTITEMRLMGDSRKSSEDHQELRDSLSKLRATDASESDKKAARETIEKFLKDEFERDQKNRREQVERLEEQVSKLRKQLDKRQESQSKIIALRMQLLENDAEGLSFPEGFNELQNINGGIPHVGGYPIDGYPPNTSYVSPPLMGGGYSPQNPPSFQSPTFQSIPPYNVPSPSRVPDQSIPRNNSGPKLPKKVEIQ